MKKQSRTKPQSPLPETELVAALARQGITIDAAVAGDVLAEMASAPLFNAEKAFFASALNALAGVPRIFTSGEDADSGSNRLMGAVTLKREASGMYAATMQPAEDDDPEVMRHADPSALGLAIGVRVAQMLGERPDVFAALDTVGFGMDDSGESVLVAKEVAHDGHANTDDDEPCLHCEALDAYNDYLAERNEPLVGNITQVHEAHHLLFFRVNEYSGDVMVLHRCDETVSQAIDHPALFVEVSEGMEVVGARVVLADSLAPAIDEKYGGMPFEGTVVASAEDEEGNLYLKVQTPMTEVDVPIERVIPMIEGSRPVPTGHLH
jgi:hypothetical protein